MKERRERPKWLTVHEGGKKDNGEPPKVQTGDDAFKFDTEEAQEEERGEFPSDVPTGSLGVDNPALTSRPEGENWRQIGEVPQGGTEEHVMESDLVRLYWNLRHNPPANFRRNVREERVAEHAPALRAWTVAALHKYLASDRVWSNPSFTEAVFQEIHARMDEGSMQPRE